MVISTTSFVPSTRFSTLAQLLTNKIKNTMNYPRTNFRKTHLQFPWQLLVCRVSWRNRPKENEAPSCVHGPRPQSNQGTPSDTKTNVFCERITTHNHISWLFMNIQCKWRRVCSPHLPDTRGNPLRYNRLYDFNLDHLKHFTI